MQEIAEFHNAGADFIQRLTKENSDMRRAVVMANDTRAIAKMKAASHKNGKQIVKNTPLEELSKKDEERALKQLAQENEAFANREQLLKDKQKKTVMGVSAYNYGQFIQNKKQRGASKSSSAQRPLSLNDASGQEKQMLASVQLPSYSEPAE